MPDVEQVAMLPRLRIQILVGRFHMRAEVGGGMPRPARIVENRPRERDQIGVAGADKASAWSNSVMSPTAITGMRVAAFTARANGT
jgi:hypothetical protein